MQAHHLVALPQATIICIVLWLTTTPWAVAQSTATDDQARGLEIAQASDTSDHGFGDSIAKVTMTIENKTKRPVVRRLTMQTLERESVNEGDKSLIVFHEPRDIAGTALLSHARIAEDDRQWLLMRSLGRVKRISSANKRGAFVSSEFSFEDLTGQELNKYEFRYLEPGEADGVPCDVVERKPTYSGSAYRSQKVWYATTDLQPRKIEFFNDREEHVKTLLLENYHQFGDYWRPLLMTMMNHKSDRTTRLEFEDFTFSQGLSSRDFDKFSLLDL